MKKLFLGLIALSSISMMADGGKSSLAQLQDSASLQNVIRYINIVLPRIYDQEIKTYQDLQKEIARLDHLYGAVAKIITQLNLKP